MCESLTLQDLEKEVLSCNKCFLRSQCNKVIFGEGHPQAKIVLIGEGPGADEDRIGRPFVGKAGQLLDKILLACGFERFTHTFICNIVKCRPPQNRVPTPDEKKSCIPFLYKQLEIIQPEIVILLGATALQSLIDPKSRISKERGKWIYWENKWVIPTYHPAALLRNPNLKRDVWEDMKKVIDKYRQLVDSQHHSDYY